MAKNDTTARYNEALVAMEAAERELDHIHSIEGPSSASANRAYGLVQDAYDALRAAYEATQS